MDIIFKRYDEDFNGAIDYDEFLKMVGYSGHPDGPPKRSNSRVDERDFKAVLIRVREAFEYHLGGDVNNPRRVKQAFTEIDRNGNNHVSMREFEDAVRILKVRVETRDLEDLYEYYDTDHKGLDYDNFLRLIGFHAGSPRGDSKADYRRRDSRVSSEAFDRIVKRIRQAFEDQLGRDYDRDPRKIKQAFEDIDRDRNGYVSKREWESAMDILRVRLDARDIEDLYEYFDTDRRGLDYHQFLELLGVTIRSPRNRDRY